MPGGPNLETFSLRALTSRASCVPERRTLELSSSVRPPCDSRTESIRDSVVNVRVGNYVSVGEHLDLDNTIV